MMDKRSGLGASIPIVMPSSVRAMAHLSMVYSLIYFSKRHYTMILPIQYAKNGVVSDYKNAIV